MSRLGELGDLGPFVLCDFVYLTLLGSLVRVLGAYSENVILRTVLQALVKVCELVTRATVVHIGTGLSFISLFVDGEAVCGNHSTNFVFLLLTTDAENLVMDLYRHEVFGQDLSVA